MLTITEIINKSFSREYEIDRQADGLVRKMLSGEASEADELSYHKLMAERARLMSSRTCGHGLKRRNTAD